VPVAVFSPYKNVGSVQRGLTFVFVERPLTREVRKDAFVTEPAP
jgi:hypothetical protein